MSVFSSFPFIRILFPFLAGIIAAIYIHHNSAVWFILSILSFALCLFETYLFKLSSQFKFRYFSGFLSCLTFFFLGTALVQLNAQSFNKNHFSNQTNCTSYKAEIIEAPVEKKNSYKVVVKIKAVHKAMKWQVTTGKMLCYIEKNKHDLYRKYFPKQGDVILFSSTVNPIDEAKNPGQFDYKQYLYYHNIYHQAYIKQSELRYLHREGNPLKNLAYDLRKNLIRSFKNCGLKGDELAVASALLFGVTDQLEPSLIRSYAGTGALHVLSVSGLHVAILYGFLQIVLGFLKTRKNGNLLLGIIILVFIWFYAFLTGLTPSVLRSSTMFTFIVIGQILSRQSSVYNSIAASAFVLLCYDPFLIMEVGFQLSYLAVLGIIVLYPIIYHQLTIKNKYLHSIWKITAVSIAAQVATFPLGLLYFHQFPNYFIFSNLLVIPLSGLILYTGIIASVFYFVPIIQFMLVYLLELLIYTLNVTVGFIEQLPYALLEGISITILEASLLYLILISWLIWYKTSKPAYIKFILGFSFIVCILQINETIQINGQKKIIVYHVNGHTAIDVIKAKQHVFIADSTFANDPDKLLFNVKHNWDDLNIAPPTTLYLHNNDSIRSFIHYKNNVLIIGKTSMQIIDSSYNNKKNRIFDCNYILLTKNARINLAKLNLNKSIIIADASNKNWRITKWKQQAAEKNLRFYSTHDKGALMVDL